MVWGKVPATIEKGREEIKDAVEHYRRDAHRFIEDNRPLVEGPETPTSILGEVLTQGMALAERLVEEAWNPATDAHSDNINRYADAINRSLPPKEQNKRYLATQRSGTLHAQIDSTLNNLTEFIDHTRTVYHGRSDIHEWDESETEMHGGAESRPWYQRLFTRGA